MKLATVNASAGQAATVAASGPRGNPDMTLAYSVPATPRATPIHPSHDPASRMTRPGHDQAVDGQREQAGISQALPGQQAERLRYGE